MVFIGGLKELAPYKQFRGRKANSFLPFIVEFLFDLYKVFGAY